ncbi:RNase H-like domain found in reverse transcriptase [Popillia japonica]
MKCPDYDQPFVIQTDASAFGIGAVLTQTHPSEGERVIAYISRSLSKPERNYSTTERECLAVLWAIEKLRPYIEGIHFTVITDHYSLVWLQNLKDPMGRLARMAVKLQQYNFKIVHRRGKDHVVADALSRSVPVIESLATVTSVVSDKWYLDLYKRVEERPISYPQFRITENRIYKYVRVKDHGLQAEDNWKLVVPKEDQLALLQRNHDHPTAGHMGIFKSVLLRMAPSSDKAV